jgi:hypothetical protein
MGNQRSSKGEPGIYVLTPYPGEDIAFGDLVIVADTGAVRYVRAMKYVLTAGSAAAHAAFLGVSMTDYTNGDGIDITVKTSGTWKYASQGGAQIDFGVSLVSYDDATNLSSTIVESVASGTPLTAAERIGVTVEATDGSGDVWMQIESRALLDGTLVNAV